MATPTKTLLFLFVFMLFAWAAASLFPVQGVQMGAFTLRMPKLSSLLATDTVPAAKVDDFLALTTAIDTGNTLQPASVNTTDSIKKVSLAKLPIIIGEGASHPLMHFFVKLLNIESSDEQVRIMHYGDSQIEGDRMSGVLRNELQKHFGGLGPGLLPIVELVPNMNYDVLPDAKWLRIASYGMQTPPNNALEYGPLMSFSTFESQGSRTKAKVTYRMNKRAYQRARSYQQAFVHLGQLTDSCIIRFYLKDSLVFEKALPPTAGYQKVGKWLGTTSWPLTVEFESSGNPQVYGVSLESVRGIVLDNIALRGSSGTIFRKSPQNHLVSAWHGMNMGLIILQFGGNAVPYILDSSAANSYGRMMTAQIRWIKKILPETSILLIGPSDMATLIEGQMQTFPMLPYINQVLKQVATKENCAYFDMFEVMGGAGSMKAWVAANPPLAAPDYIHFSPLGARKMAEVIYAVLMNEYENWKQQTSTSP